MSRKSTPDIMGNVLSAAPETWNGKELDYPLARIKVGSRLRPLADGDVADMAESIRLIGLLNPIHLLPDGTLVAGNHRRAAAEALGWTHIRARIVELDELDAELAEIDENLRRNSLTVLEEAEHLLRREELLEAKGARAKPGDNQHTAENGGGETISPPAPATTAGMARGLGLSERSAQMRLQIARNLDSQAKAAIRTTDVAGSTTQLVELARQPAERQRTIADLIAQGKAANVAEAVRLIDPPPAPKPVYWSPEAPAKADGTKQPGRIDYRPPSNEWKQALEEPAKPQPAPQKLSAWHDGVTAHTWEGYTDWDDVDQAEYDALAPIWQQPAATLDSISESRRITRWRVAARLASERRDNLAFTLQESARRLMRAERYAADDAWRADIARRNAAAVEAERQATAVATADAAFGLVDDAPPVDPWAVALATPGTQQQRGEALAAAITPWILAYCDTYGRTWQDLAKYGNPSHALSTFWQDIGKELTRRVIAVDNNVLKIAIRHAFALLGAQPAPDAEQAATAAMDAVLTPDATPVSQRDDYDGDEWYTPAEYIAAARRVMGSIDLDPASCDLAQTVVQADVYLTKIENGLGQRWIRQNLWLNPPYSDPARWVEKLLAEYDHQGSAVQQAVVLVNNATETAWFQALLKRFPVCLLAKRIAFWRHDQAGITARQGQAIFYLGPNVGAFINEFETFGPILRRVE